MQLTLPKPNCAGDVLGWLMVGEACRAKERKQFGAVRSPIPFPTSEYGCGRDQMENLVVADVIQ